VDIFDVCSTTQTLLVLSSFCEHFLLMFKLVPILAGGSNGKAAFGTVICIDKGGA